MRIAARIAIEWQDPDLWRERALKESDDRKAIAAIVALARVSGRDEPHRKEGAPKPDPALQVQMIATLERIDWDDLSEQDRLDLLRAYALTFTRLGEPDDSTRQRLGAKFEPLYPAKSREVNAELAPMLVYLEVPTAASKLMTALRTAPTQEEQLDLARALRVCTTGWTQPLREEYFRWFLKAANFKGGSSLRGFLRDIKMQAMENLSDADQLALKDILEAKPTIVSPYEALMSREVVKQYTVADLAPIVEKGVRGKRDFERGRQLFGQAGCAACHRFAGEGASIGPDLTSLAGRFSVRDILESTLDPNKEISDQYGAIRILKKNGDLVVGRVGNLSGDRLSVIENMFAPGDFTNVNRSDVESIEPSKVSMMPEGLLNYFKEDEILDLMAFLLSRGDRDSKMFSQR